MSRSSFLRPFISLSPYSSISPLYAAHPVLLLLPFLSCLCSLLHHVNSAFSTLFSSFTLVYYILLSLLIPPTHPPTRKHTPTLHQTTPHTHNRPCLHFHLESLSPSPPTHTLAPVHPHLFQHHLHYTLHTFLRSLRILKELKTNRGIGCRGIEAP